MASPTLPVSGKPKRKVGNRVAKDKVLFLIYKGEFQGDVEVVTTIGLDFIDKVMADPTLKYKKVVIPSKKRAAQVTDAPAV